MLRQCRNERHGMADAARGEGSYARKCWRRADLKKVHDV